MNIRRTRITKNLINAAAFNRINTVSDQLLIIGKGGKGLGRGVWGWIKRFLGEKEGDHSSPLEYKGEL